MNVEPDVALVGQLRFARVDAHADADRPRRKGLLRLRRCRDRVRSLRERVEEGVALGVDLGPAVRTKGLAQEAAVLGERIRVLAPELCEQPRRPFDVREEKGDGAARQVAHAKSVPRFPRLVKTQTMKEGRRGGPRSLRLGAAGPQFLLPGRKARVGAHAHLRVQPCRTGERIGVDV